MQITKHTVKLTREEFEKYVHSETYRADFHTMLLALAKVKALTVELINHLDQPMLYVTPRGNIDKA